jgi:hypothetical protein
MASETLIFESTKYRRVPDTTIFAPIVKKRRRLLLESLAVFFNVKTGRLVGRELFHNLGGNLEIGFVINC